MTVLSSAFHTAVPCPIGDGERSRRQGSRRQCSWLRHWRLLAATLLVICSFAPDAAAQQAGGEIREDALTVFLDCNAYPCDSDYFRTEVDFVNWVRDRTLAQVHLIITSNDTGGGGEVFTVAFIGLEDLDGVDDELTYTSLSTDTEDETLSGLSRVIGAGLARYSTLIGQPTAFDISASDVFEAPTDQLVSGDQVDDPWNFWVFEVGADVELEGEDTERRREYRGSFEAQRTTQTWKFEFDARGDVTRDERELADSDVVVDERTNWGTDVLLAYSLADHWSIGLMSGVGSSTRRNEKLTGNFATALEFSVFPYQEAPRRSLTARYDVRARYFDWEEVTIFGETEELRPQQRLQLRLFQRQPWGESIVALNASQYLHDTGLWNVSLFGNLEFRIVRGLNLDVRGRLAFIEDQLFISAEGLTEEEILLGRFDRPTDSSYEIAVGLSYEFGSIFNNVVNNRFD